MWLYLPRTALRIICCIWTPADYPERWTPPFRCLFGVYVKKPTTSVKPFSFPAAELRDTAAGEEGLKQMDTFEPHLIFMDLYLPDISGLDLAKKIRAFHSEIIMAIFVRYDSP